MSAALRKLLDRLVQALRALLDKFFPPKPARARPAPLSSFTVTQEPDDG